MRSKSHSLLPAAGCLLLAFSFLPCFAFAQVEADITAVKEKYKDENAVFLSRKDHCVIKMEGSLPKIYTDHYEEMLMLNDKGSLYSDRSIGHSNFEQVSDLEARALIPKEGGKGYKTVKVVDFTTKKDVSGGVFYDDYESTSFVFGNTAPGSRSIMSYKETLNEPHFFGAFFFASYVPCVESELSVVVPEDVKISYKLFNVNEKDVMFTHKGNTYTWRMNDVKKFKVEDDAPNIRYYEPHIIVKIDEYKVKGETKKLLADPAGLYDWYYSLTKGVNQDEAPELKKVVDSLVHNEADELVKVRKIFYWVEDHIKYIAFEDGLGGFIPRQGGLVCDRRYGDCKDMASIINKMLSLAGIESHLTWIGSRDIPYTYEDVPSPMSDNHMIATYIHDGKYYFLDATGKNYPLGFVTGFIQGKEGLIGKGEGKFEIAKVPEMPRESSGTVDTTYIRIKGGDLTGNGVVSSKGYEKIRLSARMQDLSEQDKVKFIKSVMLKGNNKFSVDSISYSNLGDRDKDLLIKYSYRLPDYMKVNGDETYINMNLDKKFLNDELDPEKRTAPREIDYKFTDRDVTVTEIPAGYTLGYKPPDASFSGDKFGFSIKYEMKDGKLYEDKTVYVNTLMIWPSDFAEWNKMVKQLSKAYNETISLKKSK
ncbi:MAG TPA: DUF3857 domain-containing protein [Bacteroidia bacterium]